MPTRRRPVRPTTPRPAPNAQAPRSEIDPTSANEDGRVTRWLQNLADQRLDEATRTMEIADPRLTNFRDVSPERLRIWEEEAGARLTERCIRWLRIWEKTQSNNMRVQCNVHDTTRRNSMVAIVFLSARDDKWHYGIAIPQHEKIQFFRDAFRTMTESQLAVLEQLDELGLDFDGSAGAGNAISPKDLLRRGIASGEDQVDEKSPHVDLRKGPAPRLRSIDL